MAWIHTHPSVLSERKNEKKNTPPPEHLLAVRKIWEIGVESIEMQTAIQDDSDIVTRIRKSLSKKEMERIVLLRRQLVNMVVKHWTTLFEMLVRFVGDLGRALFK